MSTALDINDWDAPTPARVQIVRHPAGPVLLIEHLQVDGTAASLIAAACEDERTTAAEEILRLLRVGADAVTVASRASEVALLAERVATVGASIDETAQRILPSTVSRVQELLTSEVARMVGDGKQQGAIDAAVQRILEEQLRELVARLAGDGGPLTEVKQLLGTVEAGLKAGLKAEGDTSRELHNRSYADLKADIAKLTERLDSERRLTDQQTRSDAELADAIARGTAKGVDFETQMEPVLDALFHALGAELECTSHLRGDDAGRKGDFVATFPPDRTSCGAQLRIAVETKDRQLSGPAARRELEAAMTNRRADSAILVFASRNLLPGGRPLKVLAAQRQVLVAYEREQPDPLMLEVAVQLACSFAAAQAQTRLRETSIDAAAIEERVARLVEIVERANNVRRPLADARRALGSIETTTAELRTEALGMLEDIRSLFGSAQAA